MSGSFRGCCKWILLWLGRAAIASTLFPSHSLPLCYVLKQTLVFFCTKTNSAKIHRFLNTPPYPIPNTKKRVNQTKCFQNLIGLVVDKSWNVILMRGLYCCKSFFLSDFVTVTLSLRFNDVVVTANKFTFYDCTAVKQLSGSMPWVHTHTHHFKLFFVSLPLSNFPSRSHKNNNYVSLFFSTISGFFHFCFYLSHYFNSASLHFIQPLNICDSLQGKAKLKPFHWLTVKWWLYWL